jgi:hypothetical protein
MLADNREAKRFEKLAYLNHHFKGKRNLQKLSVIMSRDAPDTVFAGYPGGRISG